jgi:Haloacid dehalogenase-like hydrolase
MGVMKMDYNLKGVIFGDRDVIQDDEYLPEIEKLLKFLIDRNITPIILSNDKKDNRLQLREKLCQKYQSLRWYIAEENIDKKLRKPNPNFVSDVLSNNKLDNNECIFIGNSENDMKTAVNSKILFLNAIWYGQETEYGFTFEKPKDIAQFIDVFCLREHLWGYKIKDGNLEYYALGIYGTKEEKYDYSKDLFEATKFGRGHPDFWIKYLLSAVYFSGLHKQIDYITGYPGHKKGSRFDMEVKSITTFAKCFNKKYLPDLIERHETAEKLASARANNRNTINHLTPINTIKLNEYPMKSKDNRYKKSPLKKNKTVLVIDDISTQGYSLESARLYIEKTGAKVILLSFLKTIFKEYEKIETIGDFQSPFQANTLSPPSIKKYPFWNYVVNKDGYQEIRLKLEEYENWNDW